MATTYKTPGVFIEEISKFPPSIAQVETAISAFVGYTERATKDGKDLTNQPTRIVSMLEYETFFGFAQPEENLVATIDETTDGQGNVVSQTISADFSSTAGEVPSLHNMYYAMQSYFGNGGGPCYIVSAGPYKALGTALVLAELQAGLAAVANEDEPTLIVFPEAQSLVDLTVDANATDFFTLQTDALGQCEALKDRFVIMDFHVSGESLTTSGDVNTAATLFRTGIGNSDLKYGAAYFPNIRTGFDYQYADADITITHNVDGGSGNGTHEGVALNTLETTEGALFNRIKLVLSNFPVTLPPSSTIAGVYARVDETRGVFKAPANESLNSVSSLTFKVTDSIQEGLNVDTTAGKSINAIRAFTGKGILVWGATYARRQR